MPARLVPLNPGVGPVVPIQRPVLLIGRHPECDVRIDSSKISRRHCCLALAYDRVMITDLGSRNGVRVNGLVVDQIQLFPGDEIAIGPLLYRLEDPDAAPPPSAKTTSKSKTKADATPPNAKTPATRPPSLPSLPDDLVNTSDDLLPIDL